MPSNLPPLRSVRGVRYALGGACRPAGGTGAAAEPAGADGAAAASSAPCAAAARPTITAPLVSGRPSIANTTNIETLVKALQEATAPSEQVQDKVGFIFNNLSQINLSQKVRAWAGREEGGRFLSCLGFVLNDLISHKVGYVISACELA